jgi:hypothetical protein
MTFGDSHTINHENCLPHFNVKKSVTKLRVGEATWSHPGSSERVTKSRNNSNKMGDQKRSKHRTSKALSLDTNVRYRQLPM